MGQLLDFGHEQACDPGAHLQSNNVKSQILLRLFLPMPWSGNDSSITSPARTVYWQPIDGNNHIGSALDAGRLAGTAVVGPRSNTPGLVTPISLKARRAATIDDV